MDALELSDYQEMVETAGWQRMVADAEEAIKQRESMALHVRTIEDLRFMQGEAQQLAVLVSFRAALDLVRERMNEPDDE